MFSVILFVFSFLLSTAFGNECPAGYTMEGCPEGTREMNGCCPIPKKSGWGKSTGAGGCKSGLVIEGGHCCWPEQAFVGGKCIGTPK